MCFFTGFGYYISTAVGVYALALPTIIMLWFLPDRVQLSNFFWIFPTLALYPIIAMVHKTSWTPATLRVYTISSFAHAAAIAHTLRGHAAEWVPSGSARKTSMTKTVTALLIGWSSITNVLMGAGVIKFLVDGRSIVDVFPVAFYCLLSAYIWIPVTVMAWREHQPVTTLVPTPGGNESLAA
jgi:cellulose synthase (UDP-forming)